MAKDHDRIKLLERVEKGEITPGEAINRLNSGRHEELEVEANATINILNALESGIINPAEATQMLGAKSSDQEFAPREKADTIKPSARKKSGFWLLPLFTGVGVVILSAIWMAARIESSGIDYWFILPFLLLAGGVALIVFAWASRRMIWLKVRVKNKNGKSRRKVNLGFPLPFALFELALKLTESKIKVGESKFNFSDSIDWENILENPLTIHVDEDDSEVEVSIA